MHVPDGWTIKHMSELAYINPSKSPKPFDGLVSFVPMDAVSEEARLKRTETRAYEKVEKGFTAFKNGDVLIAKITPCFENGKGAFVFGLTNGIGFGSTEFHVLRAKKENHPEFIYYLTTAKAFRTRGEANMQGSAGQKRVPTDYLKVYKVVTPPIPEQQKIAQILSTWDKAIEKLEALIAAKQKRKKALMQQLLTGKKRFTGFEGEWKRDVLGKVAEIVMGSSPKSEAYNEICKGLPLLQGNADIKNRLSAPRIYTSQITKTCNPNDILLSVRAPVGAIARSLHKACIGRGIASIKAKKGFSQDFLYQWMLYFEPKWNRLSQGSTFESVNSADIKNLHIFLPDSLEEQQKIASILSAADKEIESHQKQLTAVKEQKKGLMQQLLTGKKRVNLEA